MTELSITTRTIIGKKVKTLRQDGKIPAVVYGHNVKSISVMVDYLTFAKIYRAVGGSVLIDLKLDANKSVKALIQDVSTHPVTGKYEHVDFHQVRMDEKITAEVPIVFTGEAKAVKELGGVLVKNLNQLRIECLPDDLRQEIVVDISLLETFANSIQVKDLNLPQTWHVLNNGDELVIGVEQPRVEEVVTVAPEEDVSKVEGVETPADKTEGEVKKETGAVKAEKGKKEEKKDK
ncbi:MAG: 50S ribosomal protein L25 [Patescibacteria group bacterium]